MAERKVFLAELQNGYPKTDDISDFTWDVEYFVNADNWAAHPGSDLMMVFETVEIDVPNPKNNPTGYNNALMESIRTTIASHATTGVFTTPQSTFRKVFRIANVSVEVPTAPSKPAILSINIGGGIQEGPCPSGMNCPAELLEDFDLQVLGVNYTACASPPSILSLNQFSRIESPCTEDSPKLLVLAKSYLNMFTTDMSGVRLPDACNALPASIISQAGASANIITERIADFSVFNDAYDGVSCYEETFLYSPSYCTNDCSSEDILDCISTTARDWVLENVDDAVVKYHSSNLPSNYKWYCASSYGAASLGSGCGLGFSSWVDGMWVVE